MRKLLDALAVSIVVGAIIALLIWFTPLGLLVVITAVVTAAGIRVVFIVGSFLDRWNGGSS